MDVVKDKINKGKQMDLFNHSHRMIYHLYTLYKTSISMSDFQNKDPTDQTQTEVTKPYTVLSDPQIQYDLLTFVHT